MPDTLLKAWGEQCGYGTTARPPDALWKSAFRDASGFETSGDTHNDKDSVRAVNFSVNRVISRTLSLIEKSFQEQQIRISFQKDGNYNVNGYPNEYAQTLLNILTNARDALTAHHADNAEILIRSFSEEGKTVVTVTDNAGGIADDVITRIFEPYFTTKGADKGTGIGLYMSKCIIEKNMGGSLTVRNTEHGAEFRIVI